MSVEIQFPHLQGFLLAHETTDGLPSIVTNLNNHRLISALRQFKGAIDYSGDCSSQVLFKLANGHNLRIGITDDDVSPGRGIWIDQYGGLKLIGPHGPFIA